MGIDILGGLPHNFIAKKSKNKLGWILKKWLERKNKGCRVPFRDDGEENLPECSLQSSAPRLYTRITSCPVLC